MKKFVLPVIVFCIFSALSGCGGGGGDASPAANAVVNSPEGLWSGTTNTNRTATGLVLDDGTFYVLYTKPFSSTIAGVVQGNATASNGTISSSNAKDFNFGDGIGIVNVGISGAYTEKKSLNGSVNYGGSLGTTTFSTTYSTDYETIPSLATLTGNYTGEVVTSAGFENAFVSISSNGTLNAVGTSGCTLTGTATPRSKGNVYNFSISFGPAPCLFANQSFEGIGYYDAITRKLYAAAPNSSRTDGIMFVGTK